MMIQDSIKRDMVLRAPLDTVWDAITRPELMTKWFAHRMDVDTLEAGRVFMFDWRPEHGYSRAVVEAIEPKTRFAYRWENDNDDQTIPFAEMPTTLVTFELEEVTGGTRLRLTESGIQAMQNPAKVFDQNSGGWDYELGELRVFVEAA